MPDWLKGDPLNGFIMTITFFISMIIGNHIRKRGLLKNARIAPGIKVIGLFFLIISIMLMEHVFIPVVISLICLLVSIRMNMLRKFLQRLFFPALLGSFILAAKILSCKADWISCLLIPYSEGSASGMLIFSRVIAAASAAILMFSTSSENEITGSLRSLGVPRTMLDISLFMKRYINAFSEESKKLEFAGRSRCGFSKRAGYRGKMHDIASIAGALINRAFSRAEIIHMAMTSRGWKPDAYSTSDHISFKKEDLFSMFIFSAGILILIGIDRIL